MKYIIEGIIEAVRLIFSGDSELFRIVMLSLAVSSTATVLSSIIIVPYAVRMGLKPFKSYKKERRF